ncbi:MAG: hypothetical protein ACLFUR_02690 [Candidatus Hadarchaeia archaeon]
MTKFRAECPIEGCSFVKESYWRNTARGGVIAHIYRTKGEGHGEKGSRPSEKYEVLVKRIDDS